MDIEAEKRRNASLDPREASHFASHASDWWDEDGPLRALHQLNPARLRFILEMIRQERGPAAGTKPLSGLDILDIGCGGGILSEPLSRLGGRVTGIDPVEDAINAARAHAAAQNLDIGYRAALAEDLAREGRQFDLVIASEVIEHVANVPAFLSACRALTKTDGHLILSTINRTARSYALAIVMAERMLGLIPKGTHSWDKFITPAELTRSLSEAGFLPGTPRGLVLNPLSGAWSLSDRNLAVNYIIAAKAV